MASTTPRHPGRNSLKALSPKGRHELVVEGYYLFRTPGLEMSVHGVAVLVDNQALGRSDVEDSKT